MKTRKIEKRGEKKDEKSNDKVATYPMRINKYLALKNYSTRRGADELIEKNQVLINGRFAVLGDKVNENDNIEVRQNKKATTYKYFAYNKPVDIITHSPQKGEKDITASLPEQMRDLFPVGRLDKNSHGLIILTNDGRVTDRLLNPKHSHDKEYLVKTVNKIRNNFKEKMEAGVKIDEENTKPCEVQIIDDYTFKVILTEGKKHQIRRMCSALFNDVRDLMRIRIMNIELGSITQNGYREIKGDELSTFLKSLGL